MNEIITRMEELLTKNREVRDAIVEYACEKARAGDTERFLILSQRLLKIDEIEQTITRIIDLFRHERKYNIGE